MAQAKSGARGKPAAKSKAKPAARDKGKAKVKSKPSAARKAPALPAEPPHPAPTTPAPGVSIPAGAATPDQLAALQELSANLARAAMIAQGALAEATLKSAEQPSVAAADPFRMGAALTGVVGRLAAQPDKVLKAQADLFSGYLNLWQSTAMRLAGQPAEPVVTPERGDKRFADPEWSQNPVFDAIKQAYLLSANWPPPRCRSAAKFSMPLTRLSPRVAITSFSAAGLDIRKLDGEKASVRALVKNSIRRFSPASMSATPATRPFSQLAESR